MIERDMSLDKLQDMIEAYLADTLPGDLRRQLERQLRTRPEAAEVFSRFAPDELMVDELMVGPWRRSLDILDLHPPPGRRLWLMSLLATAAIVGRVASTAIDRRGDAAGDRLPEPGAAHTDSDS